MQGDNKNQCIVWCVSVMVLATYLLSDSTIGKGMENTRNCGFFNLNTLSSTTDIQMLVIPSLSTGSRCSLAVKMEYYHRKSMS